MKEKFTKGPWILEYGMVVLGDISYEFDNAHDAPLIACAPDMYEEIKRDIECLTRWIDNHGDAFPMTAAWKDMRASKIELLKRARGE